MLMVPNSVGKAKHLCHHPRKPQRELRCDPGGAAAQGLAERMLGDSKVEVADLAAATLSGFLRAAPPAVAAAARARYSAAVRDASATHRLKRRRNKDADTSSAEGKGPPARANICCGIHSVSIKHW